VIRLLWGIFQTLDKKRVKKYKSQNTVEEQHAFFMPFRRQNLSRISTFKKEKKIL
jgi:hypothetical protein